MLSESKFPFTGPLFGPSYPEGPDRESTVKGLKRGLIRMGFLNQALGSETDLYGPEFEDAMKRWQRSVDIDNPKGQYGRGSWVEMRQARIPAGRPNAGQYAMDSLALTYVREDVLKMCNPIDKAASGYSICQDLHQTLGLTGNWAIDFCCRAGSQVRAVESATIRKLSGRDPAWGVKPGGIFGWSIHYETPTGYRYFSTHYGTRTVAEGQFVKVGTVIGAVGDWPGNAHLHLGVTSPLGIADAKKRITNVKNSERV